MFARRHGVRASRELVAANARYLATEARALVTAYFALGMRVEELAALHRTTPGRLYRRLMAWRETLSDPAFLLAAHFAGQLPSELAEVARAHWMEGVGLRKLARERGATLHEVRTQLAEARVALVTAAGRVNTRDTACPPATADSKHEEHEAHEDARRSF